MLIMIRFSDFYYSRDFLSSSLIFLERVQTIDKTVGTFLLVIKGP